MRSLRSEFRRPGVADRRPRHRDCRTTRRTRADAARRRRNEEAESGSCASFRGRRRFRPVARLRHGEVTRASAMRAGEIPSSAKSWPELILRRRRQPGNRDRDVGNWSRALRISASSFWSGSAPSRNTGVTAAITANASGASSGAAGVPTTTGFAVTAAAPPAGGGERSGSGRLRRRETCGVWASGKR